MLVYKCNYIISVARNNYYLAVVRAYLLEGEFVCGVYVADGRDGQLYEGNDDLRVFRGLFSAELRHRNGPVAQQHHDAVHAGMLGNALYGLLNF